MYNPRHIYCTIDAAAMDGAAAARSTRTRRANEHGLGPCQAFPADGSEAPCCFGSKLLRQWNLAHSRRQLVVTLGLQVAVHAASLAMQQPDRINALQTPRSWSTIFLDYH